MLAKQAETVYSEGRDPVFAFAMKRSFENSKIVSCRRGAAAIEYMGLVMFVLVAIFLFQVYIVRGLSGRWKTGGDSVSFGRQYDPRPFGATGEGGGTLDCYYEERVGGWVDRDYVEKNCSCTLPPEDPDYTGDCLGCLAGAASMCPD